jgi:hypothetical protein
MTGARLHCIQLTICILALLCLLALHHVLAKNLGYLLGVLDGGRGTGGIDRGLLAELVADLELCGREDVGVTCMKRTVSIIGE